MLRCATSQDVPSIRVIANYHGLFDYGSYIYAKLAAKNLIHVLEIEGRVAGYVIAFPLWKQTIFCLQIGVSPNHQKHGVGTQLMNHIHSLFKDNVVYAHTLREISFNYFSSKLHYKSVLKVGPLRVIRKVL